MGWWYSKLIRPKKVRQFSALTQEREIMIIATNYKIKRKKKYLNSI